MVKRNIITINEDKCNGCGLCIPNCPEGALQVIDNKARLVSDLFCDGLGACIGHCPKGAIKIEKREAQKYDETKTMENIAKHGKNTIKAHLLHLKNHGETKYLNEAISFLKKKKISNPLEGDSDCHGDLPCGCPGSAVRTIEEPEKDDEGNGTYSENSSALRQWPVQLNLLPVNAPFFNNKELLVSADCVPFADPNFHKELKGKSLAIGCPKLDDIGHYEEKLAEIFKNNDIKKVTVLIMEVPCCRGMSMAVHNAVRKSKRKIAVTTKIVKIDGKKQ